MTTNKPATSLPWVNSKTMVNGRTKSVAPSIEKPAAPHEASQVIATLVPFTGAGANAAYIVAACNAYPKLVEALRPMINGTAWITDEQIEAARALLRELGEL